MSDDDVIAFTPYGTRLGVDGSDGKIAKTLTVIDAKFAQCVFVGTGAKGESDASLQS